MPPALQQSRRAALNAAIAGAKRGVREAQSALVEVVATGAERHRLNVALRVFNARKGIRS